MEQFEQAEQSVNNVEVAEPQQTEVLETQETQETSVNNSEVADSKPAQDAETNAQYAEARRKQELEQYKTKADEYQQNLDRVARLSGYKDHSELLGAMEDLEREQERQKYEQAGINPDKFKELVSELPEFQEMQQMKQQQQENQRLQSEANELFTEFPDLTPEQIPQEAWQLKESRGLSLLDAYLRTTYKQLGQQKEQEAIQKLQGNAQASPGSLGGGAVNHTTNINNLSSTDFQSMVDQVLRGERKQL